MKRLITPKTLLVVLFLLAGTMAKAQVSALSDLTAGTLAVYCPTDQVKLTAASTGAASYIWKRYPGANTSGTPVTLAGTTANLTDTPTDAGYYTYVSTAVNAEGCESTVSDPAIVYVLPGISAAIVSSSPSTTQYCETAIPAGLTLTATGGKTGATVSETFAYKYQWYKNGTAITGATSNTYAFANPGDAVVGTNFAYTVRITYVIKACAETTSNAINFNVIATPGKPTIVVTP
ncbi:hypothetical protein [Mucilaginibacter myungsuensis]|uniref:Ig-like domain-containing protein n=1 Tax=Mucilaginibacter myungsuensis TaxID=649104 RepID=A0A929KU76_9SPHI|nr:hypothetical protein [Mucilaginibacter myungsuensis]MBE9660872.1 hypothetical protein [Mucilaginibacter myungsuensis]MDN3600919.1 hypothetical protein [Mucilaginibacter myungsuensis]